MKYEKIKLNYNLDDLEPYIQKDIMDYHYNLLYEEAKNELNQYVDNFKDLKTKKIDQLLFNYNLLPEYLKKPVLNVGGSYLNHSLFFENLGKKNTFINNYDLLDSINNAFGSFENLKILLNKALNTLYGSGFVFLTIDFYQNLNIITSENNKNPLIEHHIPLLVLDCWEHSYYPQYKVQKKYYSENLIKIIDWSIVEKRFLEAKNNYFINLNIA